MQRKFLLLLVATMMLKEGVTSGRGMVVNSRRIVLISCVVKKR